eukprot:613112-Pyramimonas_sp.AAC.1
MAITRPSHGAGRGAKERRRLRQKNPTHAKYTTRNTPREIHHAKYTTRQCTASPAAERSLLAAATAEWMQLRNPKTLKPYSSKP